VSAIKPLTGREQAGIVAPITTFKGWNMARLSKLNIGLALAGLAVASPSFAKTRPLAAAPPPKIFNDVVLCRAIADPTQRLACFDQSVSALATAQSNRDLFVADKDAMREARKGLFGFNLPKLRIFGDDDMEKDVSQIDTTLAAVGSGSKGYIFTLKDGARWAQTDGQYMDRPKVGAAIKIKRAALGSFFASFNGNAGFRVERLNN